MHELTIVTNLIKFLEKLSRKEKAKKVLSINLKINPYSCLDEENINFIFSNLVKNNRLLENAKIYISRNIDFISREVIVESVEMETENGN